MPDMINERKTLMAPSTPRAPSYDPKSLGYRRGKLTKIVTQSVRGVYQIDQIRQWVRNCIIYRNPEWINELVTKEHEKRICYKNVRYHWFDIDNTDLFRNKSYLNFAIRTIMKATEEQKTPFINIRDLDSKFRENDITNPFTNESKLQLFLTTNTTIIKEAQKSGISMKFLIDNFWAEYIKAKNERYQRLANIEFLFLKGSMEALNWNFSDIIKKIREIYDNPNIIASLPSSLQEPARNYSKFFTAPIL